jgi:hypothetical protein
MSLNFAKIDIFHFCTLSVVEGSKGRKVEEHSFFNPLNPLQNPLPNFLLLMNNTTSKPGNLMMKVALSAIAFSTLLLPQPTLAQANGLNNSQPQHNFQTNDNPDPFSGGSGTGMFDLIHRSRLGSGRSTEEFSIEQRQNLNDAAAEFRNKQRLLLEKPALPSPEAVPTP